MSSACSISKPRVWFSTPCQSTQPQLIVFYNTFLVMSLTGLLQMAARATATYACTPDALVLSTTGSAPGAASCCCCCCCCCWCCNTGGPGPVPTGRLASWLPDVPTPAPRTVTAIAAVALPTASPACVPGLAPAPALAWERVLVSVPSPAPGLQAA